MFSIASEAQFINKFKIATGLTTTSIMGDNPAKLPMIPMTDEEDAVTGGALKHAQPGIELRFTFPVDMTETMSIPLSLDYTFFTGRERINTSQFIVDIWTHSLNIFSISTGLHYVFYKMDFANAKMYGGLEARLSFIHNIDTRAERDYLENLLPDETWIVPPKESATRFGGNLRLGVEGKLHKSLYVNTGAAFSVVNLIGKDDSRGELLTPIKFLEVKESTLSSFHVFILLQLVL
jgi:hypothetical protein